jgi:ABC-type Fe3+ transport system permease subunit
MQETYSAGLEKWLKTATAGLCDEARLRIDDETRDHFYDALEDALKSGASHDEAERRALKTLGNRWAAKWRFERIHMKMDPTRGAIFDLLSVLILPFLIAVHLMLLHLKLDFPGATAQGHFAVTRLISNLSEYCGHGCSQATLISMDHILPLALTIILTVGMPLSWLATRARTIMRHRQDNDLRRTTEICNLLILLLPVTAIATCCALLVTAPANLSFREGLFIFTQFGVPVMILLQHRRFTKIALSAAFQGPRDGEGDQEC